MLLEEIHKDIQDMSDEELFDLVKRIRKNRTETAKKIQEKVAKKAQTKQNKALKLLETGELTIEQLEEMLNEAKKAGSK